MRRLVGVLSACGVLAGVLAMSAVAADNNFRISGSYSYVDTGLCADPVQVDGTYNQTIHSSYEKDGNATRVSFTGSVKVTYTDLTSGSTYSPNVSGPGTIDLSTWQTVYRGGGSFDSSGHFIATDGRVVADSHGNLISVVGHQTDVCAALGSS
jgi:hypothetical protein